MSKIPKQMQTLKKIMMAGIIPLFVSFFLIVFTMDSSLVLVMNKNAKNIVFVKKRMKSWVYCKGKLTKKDVLLAKDNEKNLLVHIKFKNRDELERDLVKLTPVVFGDTFSIEALVRPAKNQCPMANIISNHPGFNWFEGLTIQQSGDNQNNYGFGFGDGTKWSKAVVFELAAQKWNYFVINVKRNIVELYLDGELKANIDAGAVFKNSGYPLDIGNWKEDSRPFNGLIKEVRILNDLISDVEIKKTWAGIQKRIKLLGEL